MFRRGNYLGDAKKHFLYFYTEDGIKRFYVSYFTDTKLALMIDEIVERIKLSGNIAYDGKTSKDILFSPSDVDNKKDNN